MAVRGPLAVVVVMTAAACSGGGPTVCETPLDPPAGFTQIERFEEEYEDHAGVRISYQDDADRLLHAAAGIPGEWGETSTPDGEVDLGSRGTAQLLSGIEGVWFAIWDEGDRCDPRVVIANGFERAAFLSVLEAGVAS